MTLMNIDLSAVDTTIKTATRTCAVHLFSTGGHVYNPEVHQAQNYFARYYSTLCAA